MSSTITPPTNTITLPAIRTGAILVGRSPSFTTSRPRRPSRKSLPVVGDLYSRMPRAASGPTMLHQADHGDADREQQAEVADHRHLGEAQGQEGEDGVEGDHQQGRAEGARRLLDRVLLPVDHHLLLDARVHLDRVVDAHAEHHREAGDGDDRQRDAEVAGQAEGPHARRSRTTPRGSSRHRTSKATSRMITIRPTAMAPSTSIPPVR